MYWGNRNWHPFLADTVAQMKADGVQRALAFVTSPYGSYSSCRQYLEDIDAARSTVEIHKIRHFHDHPAFIQVHADAVRAALATFPERAPVRTRIAFTAHSIPSTMDANSGPGGVGRYSAQLHETAELVAAAAAPELPWDLVWQSRSGSPQMPWLEPDINDHLESLAKSGVTEVVVSPIGFISDHLEVLWDLDVEAAQYGRAAGAARRPGRDPGRRPAFCRIGPGTGPGTAGPRTCGSSPAGKRSHLGFLPGRLLPAGKASGLGQRPETFVGDHCASERTQASRNLADRHGRGPRA